MKETVQIMAVAQENTVIIDPEAEKEQNKTGVGIIIPKEREPGAGKDTIKMSHGDGKNAGITRIITLFMEQEMVERGSTLILIKTLTNSVTCTNHIGIITARADGLTTHTPEGKERIASAAREKTSITVQYLGSSLKNTLGKGTHLQLPQLMRSLTTLAGKMKTLDLARGNTATQKEAKVKWERNTAR